MSKYILNRVLMAIPLLFVISVVLFVIMNSIGDPLAIQMSQQRPPTGQELEMMRRRMGLDMPIYLQYVYWMIGNDWTLVDPSGNGNPSEFVYGQRKGILVLGFTSWMGLARIVRANMLSLKNHEFVMAARTIGVRDVSIIFRHILPNTLAPIIVSATLGIWNVILPKATSASWVWASSRPRQAGQYDGWCAGADGFGVVAVVLPRHFDSVDGSEYKLHRRWPARRPRSPRGSLTVRPNTSRGRLESQLNSQ